MYKVNTPSKYLVKDKEKIQLGDRFYRGEELHGFRSVAHRVQLVDLETKKKTMLFPGEVIKIHPPTDLSTLTKKELLELLPEGTNKRKTNTELIALIEGA